MKPAATADSDRSRRSEREATRFKVP
jgi:hypothetical protein